MTAKEQRAKNQKKKAEREARRKKREKQRDKALKLKARELKIREANAGIRTEKAESEKLIRKAHCEELSQKREMRRKRLAEEPYSRYAPKWKQLITKIENEMKV